LFHAYEFAAALVQAVCSNRASLPFSLRIKTAPPPVLFP
jgi:hypothetical protein